MNLKKRIIKAQKEWGKSLIKIGKTSTCKPGKVEHSMNEMLKNLYHFNEKSETEILFKPTLASEHPIRVKRAGVVSYFIRGIYPEDNGFALKPWKKVKFKKFHYIQHGHQVMVMGSCIFIDYQGDKTTADYTFGYLIDDEAVELKIFLHHSSARA